MSMAISRQLSAISLVQQTNELNYILKMTVEKNSPQHFVQGRGPWTADRGRYTFRYFTVCASSLQ